MTAANASKLERWGGNLFYVIVRGSILLVIFSLIFLVYRGYHDDRFMIQAFQVPKQLEAEGISGMVMARKLQDEIDQFKRELYLVKDDSIDLRTDAPDLQVAMLGVGLSVNSLTYHVKNLFGKTNNIITGELVDRKQQLELTLRMSGARPVTRAVAYESDNSLAFDSLLNLAAKRIVQRTDPYRMAMYYIEKGENQKALQLIIYLINQDLEPEWAYVAWGELLEAEGDAEKAVEKFEKALAIKPDMAHAYQCLGWNHVYYTNDQEKALQCFRKAQELNPNDFGSINGKSIALRKMGRYEEAYEVMEELIDVEPDNYWSYANAASMLGYQLNDTLASINMWYRASKAAGESVNRYMALSYASELGGEKDSTVIYMKEALKINPDFLRAHFSLMNRYYNERDYEKAKPHIEKLVKSNPQRGWDQYYHKIRAYSLKAMIAYQQNDYELARSSILKAIDMDPNYVMPYTTLAEIYGLQEQWPAFYETMAIVIEKGVPLEKLLDEEPYISFLQQPKFRAMVEEHFRERDQAIPKEIMALMNQI